MGDLGTATTGNLVLTGSSILIQAVAFSLKNVNQTTPLTGTLVTFGAAATSSSASLAGANGDMVMDAIAATGTNTGLAPAFTSNSTGQTEVATLTSVSSTGLTTRLSVSRKGQVASPATLAWTVAFPAGSTGLGIQHVLNAKSTNKIYTSVSNGSWNAATTWLNGSIPPATLSANDKIQVLHDVDLNLNYTVAANAALEIGAAGNLTVMSSKTLINNGDVKNAGTLTNDGVVSDAGTTTFIGTLAQTVGGSAAPSFNKLLINNAAGVTFNSDTTVKDTLTLTSGNVTMSGNSVLTVGPLGGISRTSGYILGKLKKEFAGIGGFTYPVGTAAGYAPVTAVVNTLGGGDFSVTANDGTMAGTIAGQSLTRNWTLTKNNISSADITLNYNDADVPAGADESQFQFVRRSTNTNIQLVPSSFDTTANSFTLLGVTGFSDWALGKMAGPLSAAVDVAGRISTATGRGIRGVYVTLTNQAGFSRTVMSSSFGYYQFGEVGVGQVYVLSVAGKRYTFTDPLRLIAVMDAMNGQDFVADP